MVYGYASVAAFALLTGKFAELTAPNFDNALIAVVVSMVVGAILGWISEKIAGAMAGS
jgi:tetrahydromethanopterin S-methyltransferase subunit C